MHVSALWILWNRGATNHRLSTITLSASSGWLVSPVLPNTYRFWAFIRRKDECPLVKWCAVLYWVQWTQYGCASLTFIMMNQKVQLTRVAFTYTQFDGEKKHLEDISVIWRKMKHFSKSNGSICIALEGLTLACVLFCFYMDYFKKTSLSVAILVWKPMLCWSYSLGCEKLPNHPDQYLFSRLHL